MKTLELEQITKLLEEHAALAHTARSGATLASLVRGAIRGCDAKTDPEGRLREMLGIFLEMSGFESPRAEENRKLPASQTEENRCRCHCHSVTASIT